MNTMRGPGWYGEGLLVKNIVEKRKAWSDKKPTHCGLKHVKASANWAAWMKSRYLTVRKAEDESEQRQSHHSEGSTSRRRKQPHSKLSFKWATVQINVRKIFFSVAPRLRVILQHYTPLQQWGSVDARFPIYPTKWHIASLTLFSPDQLSDTFTDGGKTRRKTKQWWRGV